MLGYIVRDGMVLLIKRGTPPYFGFWCLPGGVSRDGESPEEACIREVKEETGLDVEVLHEIGRTRGTPIFLCKRTGGALRSKPPESIAIGWFQLEKVLSVSLPPFIADFIRGMRDTHEEKHKKHENK